MSKNTTLRAECKSDSQLPAAELALGSTPGLPRPTSPDSDALATEKNSSKRLTVQLFEDKTSAPVECETSWEDLAAQLTAVERTATPKLELACWSPARLSTQWRAEKNVLDVQVLVLDCDDFSSEQWSDMCAAFHGYGCAWGYHSTYSHRAVSGELCYRVFAQLSRPVPAKQWRGFYATVSEAFGSSASDAKVNDPARLFFMPFAPIAGPEPESASFDGVPLDVDAVLAASTTQPSTPTEPKPAPFTLTDAMILREVKREINSYSQKIPRLANPEKRTRAENMLAALQGLSAALTSNLTPRPAYAPEGNRDNVLLLLSGFLERAFPGASPEEIAAAIAPVLDRDFEAGDRPASATRDSETLLAKLHRDRAKRAEERATEQRARYGEPYTDEQRASIVRLAGVETEQELVRQLIIDVEKDGFRWLSPVESADGTITALDYKPYRGKNARTAAEQALGRFLTFPVTLKELTLKGEVFKSLDCLLREYSQQTVERRLSFTVQHCAYDARSRVFVEPAARLRSFGPERDPELRKYLLDLLGPVQLQALDHILYRWRDLSLPAPWLLFAATTPAGLSGRGKNKILGMGLASPWSDAGCVPYASLDGFTSELLKCPVVQADEEISRPRKGGTVLQTFKAHAYSDAIRIEKKGIDADNVPGNRRGVLTANSLTDFMSRLLIGGDESDIEAVLRRIQVFEILPTAPVVSEDFVRHVHGGHLFARYIEDLETRDQVAMPELPSYGERWRQLTTTREQTKVLDAVSTYLANDCAGDAPNVAPAVFVDAVGAVWVQPEALAKYSVQSDVLDRLTTGDVLRDLKKMSLGVEPKRRRIGGKGRDKKQGSYYQVPATRLQLDAHTLTVRQAVATALGVADSWVPTPAALANALKVASAHLPEDGTELPSTTQLANAITAELAHAAN